MNNKGFTLVELLAVMVILITISLVAVSAVTESLVRREVKECKEQQELAVNAAKIYFSMEDTDTVTVGDLKTMGYIKENKKTDRIKDEDTITMSSSEYSYNGGEVGASCS
jgi:competence protein ComGC